MRRDNAGAPAPAFPGPKGLRFFEPNRTRYLYLMQVIDKIRQNQMQEFQFAQMKTICLEAACYMPPCLLRNIYRYRYGGHTHCTEFLHSC
jgi:hypothetical protein